jgi:hypothetical protein
MKQLLNFAVLLLITACGSNEPSIEIHPKLSKGLGVIYIIENTDKFDWENVTLKFNDNWTYKMDKLSAGQTETLSVSDATDEKGQRMTANIKVSSVMICCFVKEQSACTEMLFK